MLNRTDRSALVVLLVGVFLATGPTWLARHAAAQTGEIGIRFDEIETYLQTASPRARIIDQELAMVAAERDEATQWSNPTVAYDHENVDLLSERTAILAKHFEKPFSQAAWREGWATRVRAAEIRGQQADADLLAELRTGYVRLRLLASYLDRVDKLDDLVDVASAIARSRYEDGHLSGLDSQLLQLTALSVNIYRQQILQKRYEFGAAWRAEMGLPPEAAVRLTTPVRYRSFDLADAEQYLARLDTLPGIRGQTVLVQALDKQAEAAQPDIIPAFGVFGGYKHFENGPQGWVVGLAVDLPLFDRKAGTARRLAAEHAIAEHELNISHARIRAEIVYLVALIREAERTLSAFVENLGEFENLTDTLLISYREGSLDLVGFFNAIEIEVGALESFYTEVGVYYQNLFRLEALTGTRIVHYGDQE